jgi:DNA-binding NtrC family response regulator
MPELNGLEILRIVREKDKDVAVIIMSGYVDQQMETDTAVLNVYAFMTKPFDSETLIKKIKEALASKENIKG